MKRPRPWHGALSIFAISISPHHHLAAASPSSHSTATQEDDIPSAAAAVVVDGERSGGGGGDDGPSPPLLPPLHLPPRQYDGNRNKKKRAAAPIAKLSTTGRSSRTGSAEEDAPFIPLIGVGVGNLPHNKIPYVLARALSPPPSSHAKSNSNKPGGGGELTNDYRLIDTSHGADSALEVLVGRSLSRLSSDAVPISASAGTTGAAAAGTGGTDDDYDDDVYHVMIKIWHTHLGYERTMLSVRDSLSDILPAGLDAKAKKKNGRKNNNNNKHSKHNMMHNNAAMGGGLMPDVRIHAIIQHPRCDDALFSSPRYLESHKSDFSQKHADCQSEEDALDEVTRTTTGDSPLLDRENAWKRSYRALEELYHHGTLESIGVSSDFEPEDLTGLFEMATVGPHVYQGTLETLATKEGTVEELVRHGVHYQCHDAASVVEGNREDAPAAYGALERIGAKRGGYSPVQVVLGWLVHHKGVGVVPGTADPAHLAENSPRSLGNMERLGPREALDVENAVSALVRGRDLEEEIVPVSDPNLPDGTEEVMGADGYSYRSRAAAARSGDGARDGDSNEGDADGGQRGGVVATFFNTMPRNVRIFHVHPETGEQIQISHGIPPERSGRMIVNQDDVLIAYDGHGVAVKKFLVEKPSENGSIDFSV